MDTKDTIGIAGVLVAFFVGIVQWLKYRNDVQVRQDGLRPRTAKPFVDVIHTVTTSSIAPDTHTLTIEVSNRDELPIAIKEVCWHVKPFRTRWPLSYKCASLPENELLLNHTLETPELLLLGVDIRNVFKPLSATENLPLLDMIVAIKNLEVGIILTTGEAITRRLPRGFCAFLASQLVRPTWIVPFAKLYVLARRP